MVFIWADLSSTLEEEEDLVLDHSDSEEDHHATKFCLVGYFLTDQNVNFNAMRSRVAEIWKSVKVVLIKFLGEGRGNASSPVVGDGNQDLVLACPNLASIPSYSRVVDLVCRGRTHHSNPVNEDDTRLGPIELDDPEMNEARKRKCGKMILNHGLVRSTEKEKGITSEHFLEAGPGSGAYPE
ncbi:hypothetical protein ACS0TY_023651 [Phlomoides rotata]